MRAGATRLLLQCMADLYSHPWVAAAAAAGADTSVVRLPMRSIGPVRASNMRVPPGTTTTATTMS